MAREVNCFTRDFEARFIPNKLAIKARSPYAAVMSVMSLSFPLVAGEGSRGRPLAKPTNTRVAQTRFETLKRP